MGSAAGVLTWVLVVGVGAACWHLGKAKGWLNGWLDAQRDTAARIQREQQR